MVRRNHAPPPFLLLSLIAYGASLFNDGYYAESNDPKAWAPAFGLLLIGWLGLLDGVIAWMANPLLLAGWVMLGYRRKSLATIFAIAALICIVSLQFCQTILVNEAGNRAPITSFGAGYWLWLASALLLLLGCVAMKVEPENTNTTSDSSTQTTSS